MSPPADQAAAARQSAPRTGRSAIDVVILISGRGSNMEALVRSAQSGEIPARITHVISNRGDAAGIGTARRHGIGCSVIPDLDQIGRALDRLAPDVVCMAGFMRILPPDITGRHTVLNIHPALLPMYPGLHAQGQAVRDGAGWSGCTVHLADEGVDTGPILVQYVVPVLPGDTEEALSGRILQKEHIAYAHAVRLLAARILGVDGAAAPGAGL